MTEAELEGIAATAAAVDLGWDGVGEIARPDVRQRDRRAADIQRQARQSGGWIDVIDGQHGGRHGKLHRTGTRHALLDQRKLRRVGRRRRALGQRPLVDAGEIRTAVALRRTA